MKSVIVAVVLLVGVASAKFCPRAKESNPQCISSP